MFSHFTALFQDLDILFVMSFFNMILSRDSIFLADRCNDNTLPAVEQPAAALAATSGNPLDRRAQLLKRKFNGEVPNQAGINSGTFRSRLESEIAKYRGTTPLDTGSNPLSWWRENESSFPLLARYVKANGAFQATSVASERIFNVDKLVCDDRRKSLGVETGSGLVIAQDFLMRRENPAEFRLCLQCPAPQSSVGQPTYKIDCAKHNAK